MSTLKRKFSEISETLYVEGHEKFDSKFKSETLQKLVLTIFYTENRQRKFSHRLPGPLPKSMGRAMIPKLSEKFYWMCEKSDGERRMLFIHKEHGAFLIDRNFYFYPLEWSSSTCEAFGPFSLFNGEILHHKDTSDMNKDRYIIFDTISLQGKSFIYEHFDVRRSTFHNAQLIFNTTCSPAYKLDIIFKKYFILKDGIEHLFRMIKTCNDRNSHTMHIYPKRGSNKNDGIIFMPNDDNYFCKRLPLLKWKWNGMNSIDFLIKYPFFSKELLLLDVYANAHVSNSEHKHADVVLVRSLDIDEASRTLIQNFKTRNVNQTAIVECNFDKSTGNWHIERFRDDKSEPNFITTVFATMEQIIEDITKENLIAAFKEPTVPLTSLNLLS